MITTSLLRRRRIPTSIYKQYGLSLHSDVHSDVPFRYGRCCIHTVLQQFQNSHTWNSNKSNSFSIVDARNSKLYSSTIVSYVQTPIRRYPVKFHRNVSLHRLSTTTNEVSGALESQKGMENDNTNDGNALILNTSTTLSTTEEVRTTISALQGMDEEWIPPNRPLVGDVGQAHLYAHIEDDKELSQLLSEDDENDMLKLRSDGVVTNEKNVVEAEVVPPLTSSIDWLKTRRTMLTGQTMMKPDEAALYKQSMIDIELPIIEHTLYTQQELVQCIESIGGQHVDVILDHGDARKGGRRRLGNDVLGIILVTGTNYVQMQNIANHIVRQLRRRKLQEVQVVGAELGPDGNMNDPNENWYVVDCGNYIVHIQDAKTRAAVNLAALWSGQDPIRSVDCTNEDAVDDYVTANPVPNNYTVGGSLSSTSLLYDVNNWDATMKQFEKTRWTRGNTNMINAGSSARLRNKPIVPKRRRKTSGRKT
jgi:ribosomal silencing factor RsfS